MLNQITNTKVNKLGPESRIFMKEMRTLIHKNLEEAKELSGVLDMRRHNEN